MIAGQKLQTSQSSEHRVTVKSREKYVTDMLSAILFFIGLRDTSRATQIE